MASMPSLTDAVDYLHDLVYVQGKARSTLRMDRLAEYTVEKLEARGIGPWETEVKLRSFARDKQWDVVHAAEGKPRVAISLKSILRNLAGTVPNRTDDLIGEVSDLQMRYPEVIIGYIVIVDVEDTEEEPTRSEWAETLGNRLASISGRRPPFWGRGAVEASKVVRARFAERDEAELETDPQEMVSFFDALEEQYRIRFEEPDTTLQPD